MADFKYGQMLISNKETVLEKGLSGEKVVVPAGNRVVIGFDRYAHHLGNGFIQLISKDMTIEGYSHTGVVAAIWKHLNLRLPLDAMLGDLDVEPKQVTDAIKEALEDIGLYDYGED